MSTLKKGLERNYSGCWPRARTRLFRLNKAQNGALRALPPRPRDHFSFVVPSSKINNREKPVSLVSLIIAEPINTEHTAVFRYNDTTKDRGPYTVL